MKRWLSISVLVFVPVVSMAQIDTRNATVAQPDARGQRMPKCTTSLSQVIAVQQWADLLSVQEASIKPSWKRDIITTSCSGNDCGCEVEQQYCMENCPPYPEPGWSGCFAAYRRAYKECAIACCGDF